MCWILLKGNDSPRVLCARYRATESILSCAQDLLTISSLQTLPIIHKASQNVVRECCWHTSSGCHPLWDSLPEKSHLIPDHLYRDQFQKNALPKTAIKWWLSKLSERVKDLGHFSSAGATIKGNPSSWALHKVAQGSKTCVVPLELRFWRAISMNL